MSLQFEEIEVAAPWGHISCKAWGDVANDAVLVFHGILDNAGSFDRLIPYLPTCYYYICVDLPGHGRSSHFPPNLPLHSLDNLIAYKLLVQFFSRKTYIIIGHSYGGQLGLMYAQVYPESIKKLILLDTVALIPKSVKGLPIDLRLLHESYVDAMEKLSTKTAPVYTYQEAIDKFHSNRRYGTISLDAAKCLVARSIIPTGEPDQYRLSIDQRLKFFFNPIMDMRYLCDFLKKHPPRCPILVVHASESDTQRIFFTPLIRVLQRNKGFVYKIVEGNHDVHNNNPELVGPLVHKFLMRKAKSKL